MFKLEEKVKLMESLLEKSRLSLTRPRDFFRTTPDSPLHQPQTRAKKNVKDIAQGQFN